MVIRVKEKIIHYLTVLKVMIKKEYQKPTMNVAQLKTQTHILQVSRANTTGLDRDLEYKKGTGDMDNAYSRQRGIWFNME